MNQTSLQEEGFDFDRQGGDELNFDLKAFLLKYLRYWYWFAIALAIAYAGAKLYLRYSIPEYAANSLLLIKDGDSDKALTEEAIFQDLGILNSTNNLLNEIEILRSRTLMEEVVRTLGLHTSYKAIGRFKESVLYRNSPVQVDTSFGTLDQLYGTKVVVQVLDSNSFALIEDDEVVERYQFNEFVILENGNFKLEKTEIFSENNHFPVEINFREPIKVALSLLDNLSIRPVEDRSSVIRLAIEDESPIRAVDVLNELVRAYNDATVQDKNKVAKNTLAFIEDRLDYLTTELADVEGDVERYKLRNEIPIDLQTGATETMGRINEYEVRLSELEIDKRIIESVRGAIQQSEQAYELLPAAISQEYTELSNLIEQYNQLILQREKILPSAGEENQSLLLLENQIGEQKLNIIKSINQLLGSLNLTIQQTETKYLNLQRVLRSVPRKERELLEKRRQQAIKENLYLYLLQKREETALSLAVAIPNSRVIDAAIEQPNPIFPKPLNIYAIAVFLGMSFPIGLILLREALNDNILNVEELKKRTQIPMAGTIGLSAGKKNIVVGKTSRTAVAEMFRLLRTNLQFMVKKTEAPVWLITSGDSGEGKTFITVNLGISMAISDKRTVLVGLDLRKPKLGTYLDSEDSLRGITNYLVGSAELEDIIQKSELHPNLHFITSGPIPPNPAELLMSEEMVTLIENLKHEYDCILLDSPPVGLVADAFLLNRHATNCLFVVRQQVTKKRIISYIDELYRQRKLNRMAFVFNGVMRNVNYGYGYGYGYGYYEDDKKRSWWQRRKR